MRCRGGVRSWVTSWVRKQMSLQITQFFHKLLPQEAQSEGEEFYTHLIEDGAERATTSSWILSHINMFLKMSDRFRRSQPT